MLRIAAILELEVKKGHLEFNLCKSLCKRLEAQASPEFKVLIPYLDASVYRLAQHHQNLYWLIRCTGVRVVEAVGIHRSDFDFNRLAIVGQKYPDRPYKTKFS